MPISEFCACGAKRRPGQRTCRACHARYQRVWTKTHEVSEEQCRKGIARSHANVYKRRGKLLQQPCARCNNADSEMHHEDYSQPLNIKWLCRECHLALHREDFT